MRKGDLMNQNIKGERVAFLGEAWQTPPLPSDPHEHHRQKRGPAAVTCPLAGSSEDTAPLRPCQRQVTWIPSGPTSVSPSPRDVLRNNWPVIFKSDKLMTCKERLKNHCGLKGTKTLDNHTQRVPPDWAVFLGRALLGQLANLNGAVLTYRCYFPDFYDCVLEEITS